MSSFSDEYGTGSRAHTLGHTATSSRKFTKSPQLGSPHCLSSVAQVFMPTHGSPTMNNQG